MNKSNVNVPYVKILDEEGNLTNPIGKNEVYRSPFPNRRARRS